MISEADGRALALLSPLPWRQSPLLGLLPNRGGWCVLPSTPSPSMTSCLPSSPLSPLLAFSPPGYSSQASFFVLGFDEKNS